MADLCKYNAIDGFQGSIFLEEIYWIKWLPSIRAAINIPTGT